MRRYAKIISMSLVHKGNHSLITKDKPRALHVKQDVILSKAKCTVLGSFRLGLLVDNTEKSVDPNLSNSTDGNSNK